MSDCGSKGAGSAAQSSMLKQNTRDSFKHAHIIRHCHACLPAAARQQLDSKVLRMLSRCMGLQLGQALARQAMSCRKLEMQLCAAQAGWRSCQDC